MKTSMVINGMPTVIKAFAEARIEIQNYLHELGMCTWKKSNMLSNKEKCSAVSVITLCWTSLQNINPHTQHMCKVPRILWNHPTMRATASTALGSTSGSCASALIFPLHQAHSWAQCFKRDTQMG